MIDSLNLNEIKVLIKKEKKPIIIKAQSNEFNRKLLDQCKFDVLLSPEAENKKDSLRQIDSGLNEVLAGIAKKKGISIGVDMVELKKLERKEKAIRLTKLRQNIELCRKSDVRLAIINSKDKREVNSFLISLGASTKQAKDAMFI